MTEVFKPDEVEVELGCVGGEKAGDCSLVVFGNSRVGTLPVA